MADERHVPGATGSVTGGGPPPRVIVRIENGLVAALALLGTYLIAPNLWWLPLAVFLVFDLSMLGYLRSTTLGALWYNAVHTYVWPAVLAAVAMAMNAASSSAATWTALAALAWTVHVGFDRMMGYGLKLPDAFTSTHLGTIGNQRARAGTSPTSA